MMVMAGFMLTKGVSFLQTIIIAGRFGAGSDYDTFAAGSIAPDYIVRLIGGGALGVAFIPIFSGLLNQNQTEAAWRLANQVLNTLLIIALGLALLIMILAYPLVDQVIATGLNPQETAQTAGLMRILSLAAVLFCMSGLVSGILHGHNHFLLPALAPIFQDLGLLFGVVFFLGPLGIYGLAWGTLLGAVLHLGIQLPMLWRMRFQWRPLLDWGDPHLRQVFRLMLPRMVIALTFLVDLTLITNINSNLGEGAISAFSWSLRFIDIPQAILGTTVGIVLFPTLSALTAMGDKTARLAAFEGALRFILASTIPAMAGLVLVSYDALRILFDEWDSAIIFTSIQVMSLAIVVQSLHEILTRSFYAEQDTFRPLLYAIVASVVTVAFVLGGYWVYQQFDPALPLWHPLAVGVPAFGYVMTFLVEVVLLAYFLRRRWGDIALPALLATAGRSLGATLLMVAVILLVRLGMVNLGLNAYSVAHIGLRILAEVGAGLLSFYLAARWFNLPEVTQLTALIREQFNRKPQEAQV
jgi:putative peptidoglycan lipid II flippase